MDHKPTQAETFRTLAVSQAKLGFVEQAFLSIHTISIITVQFQTLEILLKIAQQQHNTPLTEKILQHANSLTQQLPDAQQQVNALLLTAAIMLNKQHLKQAEHLLQHYKQKIEVLSITQHAHINIMAKLITQLANQQQYDWIEYFIGTRSNASEQLYLRTQYAISLLSTTKPLAIRQLHKIKQHVAGLSNAKTLHAIISPFIRLTVQFDDLQTARKFALSLKNPRDQIKAVALLVGQLAQQGNIIQAKQQLIMLLQKVRQQDLLQSNKLSRSAMPSIYSDTAYAIREIVRALVKLGQLENAFHLAVRIRQEQVTIRGQTLTNLAVQQAKNGDINAALLSMESIQRSINRASALAQIAGVVAHSTEFESVNRALLIAQRINRPSWYAVALSEISAAQAKKGKSKAAIKTLSHIAHSYSLVYALCAVAESLQI